MTGVGLPTAAGVAMLVLVLVLVLVLALALAVKLVLTARRFRRWTRAGAARVADSARRPAAAGGRDRLPPAIRRWARHAGVAAAPPGDAPRRVWLRQEAELALGPGRWRPLRARQVIAADPPGFVWQCRLRSGPAVFAAVDRLVDGDGALEVRLFGTVPVQRVGGRAATEGELYRWLAELVWLPTALLDHPGIAWRARGADAAEAVLSLPGLPSVAVVFTVDAQGRLRTAEAAARPRATVGEAVPTPWRAVFTEAETAFGPWRLPAGVEVAWIVDGTAEPYFRGRFTGAAYD